MKFYATLALILATTNAGKLKQKLHSQVTGAPSVNDLIAAIDQDGNGTVSKEEVYAYVDKMIDGQCA